MAHTVPWADGSWTNEPADVRSDADGLHVTARKGSDAWRLTSYGFIHSTEHALLTKLEPESALEVQFRLDFTDQFDQAGIFVKVNTESWIKAGVELSDGEESLGAVVTRGQSDWSLSPVPSWAGRLVTVRGSWSGNALTVRARVGDERWRLIRVAPLEEAALVTAGPFCCAPTRAGLTVHFTSWRISPPDTRLHPDA